ncbi:unknown protein [Parachlamydia acanthamoebae UV-7]|uniref:Uncharacterized protein n=2 Tax=Parachlamydia acanthamoebae TaxID=83552 RepID=F8KWJ2_PARAV|nr:hypothetical protein DB43_AS00390 [Parachlamydia acanthamoebae]CCB85392.1 unknown protein [Parachlamydia acanthamoebae UV-7]
MKKYFFYFCIVRLIVSNTYALRITRKNSSLFLKYLMHQTFVGYTLCGEKPVSIEQFCELSKIPPMVPLLD